MFYDIRFKLASNFVIVGPSQAGKTTFVEKLIKYKRVLFDQQPKRIVWCSDSKPANGDYYYVKGLPKLELIKPYDLIVIDDLFLEASESKDISALFTKYTHHLPCGVIFLTQNLFYQSRQQRNRALNTHYLILFKNPRDALAIQILGKQMAINAKEIYKDATKEPHSYLIIDFHQSTPEEIRFRTRVLPHEYPPIVYLIND